MICFRILIIDLNENISQTHSNDQIMIISMHGLLNSLKTAHRSNINEHVNILWSKVITYLCMYY